MDKYFLYHLVKGEGAKSPMKIHERKWCPDCKRLEIMIMIVISGNFWHYRNIIPFSPYTILVCCITCSASRTENHDSEGFHNYEKIIYEELLSCLLKDISNKGTWTKSDCLSNIQKTKVSTRSYTHFMFRNISNEICVPYLNLYIYHSNSNNSWWSEATIGIQQVIKSL